MANASKLTEKETNKCFDDIIKGVGLSNFLQYIFTIGVSKEEYDKAKLSEPDFDERFHKLLSDWSKECRMGGLTTDLRNFLKDVRKEVTKFERNRNLDNTLFVDGSRVLHYNRNLAWLLFSVAQHYLTGNKFMQIVRLKLEVLEADIERMKKNHRDDILARNFELLWCWLNTRRANGHENESVQDIYEALKSLGIFILPQGQASDPPSILESSESDDVTSAAQPRVDELVEHYVNAYEEGNPQQLNASVSPNHPSSSISVERPSASVSQVDGDCGTASTDQNISAAQNYPVTQTDAIKEEASSFGDSNSKTFDDESSHPDKKPEGDFDLDISGDICSHNSNDVKVIPATADDFFKHTQPKSKIYPVSNNPKGHALILNNIDFAKFADRNGAEKDCKLMKKLFGEKGLGFKTHIYENNTADEMWEILTKFASNDFHKQADMCVVVIMSHGFHNPKKGDLIFGTNGKHEKGIPKFKKGNYKNYIIADKVVGLFDNANCPNLKKKPKMFFFQFCRGGAPDPGVKESDEADSIDSGDSIQESLNELLPKEDETDNPDHEPTRTDMLIAFASQKGTSAFRSWFTNAMVNVFSQNAHKDHVADMMTDVNDGISQKLSNAPKNTKIHKRKQMAEFKSNLRKRVFFYPGFPNEECV